MSSTITGQIIIIVVFIALMYFILIRPERNKEKKINEMRSSITIGDEIVTIGGICGKVVKTKEDSLVIQVGADKVRFEVKRWAVSAVEKKSAKHEEAELSKNNMLSEDKPAEKKRIKRLGRKKSESMESELEDIKADTSEAANADAADEAEKVAEDAEIAESGMDTGIAEAADAPEAAESAEDVNN